ncbi:hypothetical protein Cgig2_005768 [Carnegiea gigantea]|uniref:Uncharacterized protein n=1 Tax=Carnegiea gigantea TaxID=171969 RepID=A0A9Q1JMZ1_9CARY|nr:hypothetical protein Cgig2_005768 [Carnegiea gigantea]
MATCSLMTLGGSAEPEGAKSHDLARRFTRAGSSLAPPRATLRRRPDFLIRSCPLLGRPSQRQLLSPRTLRGRQVGPFRGRAKAAATSCPSSGHRNACGHLREEGSLIRSGYKEAGGTKKEVVLEVRQFRSQLRGSLSLDLIRRRSGSFLASSILDMNNGSGLR